MTVQVHVRRKPDRDSLQLWYVCPLTGKQRTKSAGTDNPKLAERKASEWEAELASHAIIENPTWKQFRQRFEDEYLVSKPKNTRISYTSALNNFERHVGCVAALSLITPSVISQFAAKFSKTVESSITVASNLRHLRAALRWAESMELLRRAPRVVVPKVGKRRLARSRGITKDELNQMKAVVRELRPADEVSSWKRLLDLLWFSGLRIGEGLVLSWDEPPIRVDLDSEKYPRLVIFGEGQKSGNDEIAIMAPDFAEWLRETPKAQRTGKVVAGLDRFSRSAASHVLSACGERAKVNTGPNKFGSAHDIRRAFGQRWARLVKPLTLQKMMRHSTLQTTLNYYVDIGDDDVGGDLWEPGGVPRLVPLEPIPTSGGKKKPRKSSAKNKNPKTIR